MLRTPDRRRVVYVTAEKLIRGARTATLALRGVALGELTLATMTPSRRSRVDGRRAAPRDRRGRRDDHLQDRRRSRLGAVPARRPGATLDPAAAEIRRGGAGRSSPRAARRPAPDAGAGQRPGGCRATAREITAPGKPRTIVVSAPGRPARRIGEAVRRRPGRSSDTMSRPQVFSLEDDDAKPKNLRCRCRWDNVGPCRQKLVSSGSSRRCSSRPGSRFGRWRRRPPASAIRGSGRARRSAGSVRVAVARDARSGAVAAHRRLRRRSAPQLAPRCPRAHASARGR